MALVLYLLVAGALIALWSRFVQRLTLAVAIALVLLPMLFTGRALLTGRVYAPIDLPFAYEPLKSYAPAFGAGAPHDVAISDLHCQVIPWQKAVRYALAQGEWPLWNPFMLCGDVLAAAAQPAVYDPFHLIALLLPLPHALTFGASITFFLAGFFTWAFARSSGRSEIAALVAAAAFMFSGMMAFFVGWPLGRSWALLPWVLFGVRRVVREQKAGVLLCALVLLIVAGHPETVLHVVAAGVAYGVFELFAARLRAMRAIALAVGTGVVALLLTAIYLLPFHDASSQTLEHEIRTQLYAPASYEQLAPPSTRAHRLGRTFLPFFDGQPWRGTAIANWDPLSARAGSIAVALALAALFVAPKRGETWFFFGLAIVGLGATVGTWPFAHLLHELPLFDIAINERLAFASAFAMAMLAAIAIDSVRRSSAIIVAAVAIALTTAAILTHQPALMWVEIAPLLVIAAILLMRWRHAAIAILALVLVQRAIVDGSIYPSLPRSMFYPRVATIDAIPKKGIFRIVGAGYSLIPNGSALYELEDVRGYEAMTFKRLADTYPLWSRFQQAWFNIVDDPSRPFLSFLNVRYVIDGARVVENDRVLPRAFVPQRVRYEREGRQVLEAMQTATDFSDLAWIEVAAYEPHDAPNGPGRVAIRRDGLAWNLDAEMEGAGWIVMSETAWRGWRAYVDGHRVQTHFANHAFLGVHVPAGRHRVRLVYLPESFTRGRNVTLVTLVLLAGYAVARFRRYAASKTAQPRNRVTAQPL